MTGPGADGVPDRFAIRTATPADLDALVELAQRYSQIDHHHFDEGRTRSALCGLLDEPRWGAVLVALQGPTAIGYAVVTLGYSIESGGVEALLDEIYLDVRGQGFGSLLLRRLIDQARAWGAHRLFLETEVDNARARAFYRRHHFQPEDSIWLSLDL
jgi:GNAT superfamily N-acetyltransferase